MLSVLKGRITERRDDEGFTLIELMVVILIIAILLAIAIPTFLGARSRAQDRAAQSSLRNALTSADVGYANTNNYSESDSSSLKALEPALTFEDGNTSALSTGPNDISAAFQLAGGSTAPDYQQWGGAVLSKSGQCYYVTTVKVAGSSGQTAGTWYGQTTDKTKCDGTHTMAASVTATSWS